MSRHRHRLRLVAGLALLAASVAGCGESEAERAAEHDLTQAADVTTCRAAATPVASYGDGFPSDWPFPARTTVYGSEDRGDAGTIITAVTAVPFPAVLDFMNHQVADAGYTVERGETEEHDAEAEWRGNGFHGRWAVQESASCPGETLIQVVAGR